MKRIVQIKEYEFDESIHLLQSALELLQTLYRKGEKVKLAEDNLKSAIYRLTHHEEN